MDITLALLQVQIDSEAVAVDIAVSQVRREHDLVVRYRGTAPCVLNEAGYLLALAEELEAIDVLRFLEGLFWRSN